MAIFNTVYGGEKKWKPWANTIAYYPLNSTTTVNDMSGNNRNLTNNWATFGTYQWISCVYWNANMQRLTTPSLGQVKTISFWTNWSWVEASTWSLYSVLFSWNKVWTLLYFNSQSKMRLYDTTTDLDTTTYKTNQWYHITVVYDNIAKMYINWVLDLQWTNTPVLWTDLIYLFRFYWTWTTLDWYSWWMSELILENKARTAQEVLNYYNLTKSNYGL
jgi:hypothetical protein